MLDFLRRDRRNTFKESMVFLTWNGPLPTRRTLPLPLPSRPRARTRPPLLPTLQSPLDDHSPPSTPSPTRYPPPTLLPTHDQQQPFPTSPSLTPIPPTTPPSLPPPLLASPAEAPPPQLPRHPQQTPTPSLLLHHLARLSRLSSNRGSSRRRRETGRFLREVSRSSLEALSPTWSPRQEDGHV